MGVEDMAHLLFDCDCWDHEREELESKISETVAKATGGHLDNHWGLPDLGNRLTLMGPLLGGGPWPGNAGIELTPAEHYQVIKATAEYLGRVMRKREHKLTLLTNARALVRGQLSTKGLYRPPNTIELLAHKHLHVWITVGSLSVTPQKERWLPC